MYRFTAKVYRISKGVKRSYSYKATVRRDVATKIGAEGDGVLLSWRGNKFPTVITKLHSSHSFVYSFTLPQKIGRMRGTGKIELEAIGKSLPFYFQGKRIATTTMKKPFYFFPIGKRRLVWIHTKGCAPIETKSEISLEKDGYSLIELAGAFACEGQKYTKRGHHKNRLSFSNGERSEIEWFLRAFNTIFGAQGWKMQILHSAQRNSDEIKQYWSWCGVASNDIQLVENFTVVYPYGVCILYMDNTCLAELFWSVYERCKKMSILNGRNAVHYLRGLSRGDVGVSLKRSGSMGYVSYSTEGKEDVELFRKVCKKLVIETSKPYFSSGCWNSYIVGYPNFMRLAHLNAIKHATRKERLIKGLRTARKSRRIYYLNSVERGNISTSKISHDLSVSIVTARALVASLKRRGYLRVERTGKRGKRFYCLTKRGKEELRQNAFLTVNENDQTANRGHSRTFVGASSTNRTRGPRQDKPAG